MPIRLSGMISGMDTDALVKELMSAYSKKKDNIVKSQTKHEWKTDAWKSMNSKIYGFYSTKLSSMRLSSSFSLKSTSITKASAATVSAGSNAVNGTHTLKITQLASSAYLTGGVVKTTAGDKVDGSTNMSELGVLSGAKLKVGDSEIEITEDMTVDRFTAALKTAGVQASFDKTNQRFFVSAKQSGEEGEFAILAGNADGLKALQQTGLFAVKDTQKNETIEMKRYRELAELNDGSELSNTAKAIVDAVDGKVSLTGDERKIVADYEAEAAKVKTFENNQKLISTFAEKTQLVADEEDKIEGYLDLLAKSKEDKVNEETGETETVRKPYTSSELREMKSYVEDNADSIDPDVQKEVEKKRQILEAKEKYDAYTYAKAYIEDEGVKEKLNSAQEYVTDTDNIDTYNSAKTYINDAAKTAEYNAAKMALNSVSAAQIKTDAARISGKDAVIELNGAVFTNGTGTFSINGLSITANEVTGDEVVSIGVSNDTKGMYNKIKEFIKGYNELVQEMDKAYNASSADKYQPLTDEEKDEMSEKEIEKWEQKIKDSLLRRDSTLGGVSSSMKNLMASTIDIDGEKYSLADFGIKTAGYMLSSKETRGVYHIDGDSEDTLTSGYADKLMAAINDNPEKVVEFFNKLSSKVYNDLTKRMASSSVSSVYTVYNDKQMQKEENTFKTQLSDMEDKLAKIEESYYKKFAAMEKALSEMQSKTSSLQGLLGYNNQ